MTVDSSLLVDTVVQSVVPYLSDKLFLVQVDNQCLFHRLHGFNLFDA